MIYEDAEERYANVQKLGGDVLESAYAVLYPPALDGEVVAINPLPGMPRVEVVRGDNGCVLVDAQNGLGEVRAADGSLQGVKGELAVDCADDSDSIWPITHHVQREPVDGDEGREDCFHLRQAGRVGCGAI